MSQTWTDDVFSKSHGYDTDLGNMEHNFAALKSLFSGTSQPASMAACHPWFDTTKKVLKVRDSTNAAWVGLMHGDSSQKVWIYRNSAMDGWAIDSSVEDKVLALKGGTTYTTGAATAGSWTLSGMTVTNSHNHQWYNYDGSSHDESYNSAGTAVDISVTGNPSGYVHFDVGSGVGNVNPAADYYTTKVGAGEAVGSDATWRAAAAVGTLQYLSL